MRRLLVFGAGAAVIGTLLLITAFYETYLIVDKLQTDLGTGAAASNNLLEASSLEAIFLGIMAALGYVLIAQGLDGIRKQELIDLQKGSQLAAQVRTRPFSQVRGERPSGWASTTSKEGGAAPTSAGASAQAGATTGSSARAPAASEKPAGPVSPTPGTGSTSEPPMPLERPIQAQQPSMEQGAESLNPPTRVAPEGTSGTGTPSSFGGPSAAESQTYTTPPSAPESTYEAKPVLEPGESGAVAWEGGKPPPLEGVEVLPEPTEHGAWSPPAEAPSGGTPETLVVKRGRGRPKGSKKKKKQEPEQSETPQPPQTEQPPQSTEPSQPEQSSQPPQSTS